MTHVNDGVGRLFKFYNLHALRRVMVHLLASAKLASGGCVLNSSRRRMQGLKS